MIHVSIPTKEKFFKNDKSIKGLQDKLKQWNQISEKPKQNQE